jgi:hypothetical protein
VDSLPCAANSHDAMMKPSVNMYPKTTAADAAMAPEINGGY